MDTYAVQCSMRTIREVTSDEGWQCLSARGTTSDKGWQGQCEYVAQREKEGGGPGWLCVQLGRGRRGRNSGVRKTNKCGEVGWGGK